MDNDFLDIDVAQPEDRPHVSSKLAKLASYAVVTVLEYHPAEEGVNVTLVSECDGDEIYHMESDPEGYPSVEEALEGARKHLADNPSAVAYALVLDSLGGFPDFPARRPLDDKGREYDPDQPVVAAYLGERGNPDGVLVVQPYVGRWFRGGATPMGAPLITVGPDSLLD